MRKTTFNLKSFIELTSIEGSACYHRPMHAPCGARKSRPKKSHVMDGEGCVYMRRARDVRCAPRALFISYITAFHSPAFSESHSVNYMENVECVLLLSLNLRLEIKLRENKE